MRAKGLLLAFNSVLAAAALSACSGGGSALAPPTSATTNTAATAIQVNAQNECTANGQTLSGCSVIQLGPAATPPPSQYPVAYNGVVCVPPNWIENPGNVCMTTVQVTISSTRVFP